MRWKKAMALRHIIPSAVSRPNRSARHWPRPGTFWQLSRQGGRSAPSKSEPRARQPSAPRFRKCSVWRHRSSKSAAAPSARRKGE